MLLQLNHIISALRTLFFAFVCVSVIGLYGPQAQAIPIEADIAFVIDESTSMGTVQANIRNNIGAFASILTGGDVDARFALVGYGNAATSARLITDFTDATSFATAALNLETTGNSEPGYTSIMTALNGGPTPFATPLTYRTGAVKNIIIVTDEPSNSDPAGGQYADVDALLTAEDALLNGIIEPIFAATISINPNEAWQDLIAGHGGTLFDLTEFNTTDPSVIDAFVQNFAETKLQEIQNQAPPPQPGPGVLPEPGTLALLSLGLAGFGFARRRRLQ